MIRKLILPALAAAMLAGCVTYQYRDGSGGDYYYGQPSTEYRYYGVPYGGYGYGYPPGYGYGSGWGGSIGYYGGWYSPPRYPGHSGGHSHGHGPRPGGNQGQGQDQGGNQQVPPPDRPRPPWRDLGRLDPSQRAHVEARQPMPAEQREAGSPVRRAVPDMVMPRVGRSKRDAHPVSVP